MEHIASLLRSLASLAWPAFAFVALHTFREELKQALGRVTKAEILGQKVELNAALAHLEISATEAEVEVGKLPVEEGHISGADQSEELDSTIKVILHQATSNPTIALMSLGAELEKRARQALAVRGLLRGRQAVPMNQALSELHQYGFPPQLSASLESFDELRNTIVHGTQATDADVLRAIDSGIMILRALTALPNEVNIVYHPGVDVFSDAGCTKPIRDAKGVILETTSPGGVIKTHRIFPTTRTHFQKGKRVAWEWNIQRSWPAAWYRDPDTGEIKEAWVSSAEFIARHLDDI